MQKKQQHGEGEAWGGPILGFGWRAIRGGGHGERNEDGGENDNKGHSKLFLPPKQLIILLQYRQYLTTKNTEL